MKPIILYLSVIIFGAVLCFSCSQNINSLSKKSIETNLCYYCPKVKRGDLVTTEYDVAVYGGTPAGVTAAIQAARMGKNAILLSSNQHVGGMTSGGLTATDIGKKESVGGLAMEFYERLGKLRMFSPSEAENLYLKMLEEVEVTVLFDRWLESVQKEGTRIVSIKMETNEVFKAKVFIDATYEGDLLAASDVSYTVGREPQNAYGEDLAGQWQDISWQNVYQFCRLPISPYIEADNPGSGLIAEVSSELPGLKGEGDYKVQAYNFRHFLTKDSNRIPFPKPDSYNPDRYALLARFLNYDPNVRFVFNYTTAPMTDGPVQLREGDSNNAGSFSTDYVGGNYKWPDGTYNPGSFNVLPPPRKGMPISLSELYEIREEIFQDHVNYQQGLMYFLANDPQVPDTIRAKVNLWGLDPNEFQKTGYWPHQLYIREGRRMVSDYVMTEANCQSEITVSDGVGLASYAMDSHFCQRVPVEENGKMVVRNEGGFGKSLPRPYPISYRAIVPQKMECSNLIVPVCLSASHVAFGSIRMEPVFMVLGQSAGTAAVFAINEEMAVQDVEYSKLKKQLLIDGMVLEFN